MSDKNKRYSSSYDITAHLYSLFTGMLFIITGKTEKQFRKKIYQKWRVKNFELFDPALAGEFSKFSHAFHKSRKWSRSEQNVLFTSLSIKKNTYFRFLTIKRLLFLFRRVFKPFARTPHGLQG